jgi:Domain of unknown function (DUF6901)
MEELASHSGSLYDPEAVSACLKLVGEKSFSLDSFEKGGVAAMATPYCIDYLFCFEDGRRKAFTVRLDPRRLTRIRPKTNTPPAWARRDYHQCSCCPLPPDPSAHCPTAADMADVIQDFSGVMSYDTCQVRCVTPERTYLKKTAVMTGLASLLGLVMATSGCPPMAFLVPMARFHLPFASIEETLLRSTSIFLLRQYFEHKNGNHPDLDLNRLRAHYDDLQVINKGILARIQQVCSNDCDKNAIFSFHSMAQLFSMEIDLNLGSLAYLFDPLIHPTVNPPT